MSENRHTDEELANLQPMSFCPDPIERRKLGDLAAARPILRGALAEMETAVRAVRDHIEERTDHSDCLEAELATYEHCIEILCRHGAIPEEEA